MNREPVPLYYTSWWRRFIAFMVDGLVMFPFIMVQLKLARISPRLHAASFIPVAMLLYFYWIYCHGRWGRTLGKYLTGIRVVAMDGSHITWRQAFLRSSVDIALGIVGWCAVIPAHWSVPLDGYATLERRYQFELVRSFWPSWYPPFMKVQQGWMWSEFVVILFNKKRRALHDFVAGTVVVQKKPTRRQAKAENPYDMDVSKELKRLQKTL